MAGPPATSGHPPIRSFHHTDFDTDAILAAKDCTVSVCLPARNEAATVAPIVEAIHRHVVAPGLADELLVLDDHSEDDTARLAADAGATVVAADDVLVEHRTGHGKGAALWKSLAASKGDVVVWCDADIEDFGPRFVTGVLGPLVCEPGVELVKGFYQRPTVDGTGGGRVTELVARPLLSMLFPEIAGLHQPLSGEYGGRRDVLERMPFVQGYGVEVGLLIDVAAAYGVDSIAQVDLDVRHHRNRPLAELSPQAMAVAGTILHKAQPGLVDADAPLLLPDGTAVPVDVRERPPLVELAENARPAIRGPR